ncbi:ribbon-helix-helix protein, CopG family [Nocardiopsis sp. CNT312]|uniref:type II toxin-antitoxin system VapB family antitoxin n=1 Tax=Nocardiopsis sp. CNT312 TaxID=1137268 RepID=UPI00048B73F1|nr:ribbon-helix-helix protein, CopG family [Nocardiopsis sp. CNT312]
MSDVLIRNVPDGVLDVIDADAARQGLSRSEYLRRSLEQMARTAGASVTVDDLLRFSETFSDLEDPDVMKRAWE